MKRIRTLISILCAAVIILCCFTPCFAADGRQLKFNSDGKFKIMLAADTHCTDQLYSELPEFLDLVLESEKPDLVIFMGDNVKGYWVGSTPMSVKSAISQLVEPIAKRNIPYTAVYGNHDYQTLVLKSLQTKYFQMNDCCMMESGYRYLHRTANHNLVINGNSTDKAVYNLFMLDSGTKDANEELQPVYKQQLDWYDKTRKALEEENNGAVPSLVFQHIPIYEVEKLFDKAEKDDEGAIMCGNLANPGYYTLKNGVDGVLAASPKVPVENSGEYDAFVRGGDVKGVFFAHDHNNTYCGTTEDGIMLGAVTTSGFQSNGKDELRGVRIIELDENNVDNINTYMVFYEDFKDIEGVSWFGGNYPEQKKDYDTSLRFKMIWKYFLDLLSF